MKIVVVGVGALGSHLLLAARNVPAEWKIVDFDSVEMKNIQSQFHTRITLARFSPPLLHLPHPPL